LAAQLKSDEQDPNTTAEREAHDMLYTARLKTLTDEGAFLEGAAASLRKARIQRGIDRRFSADREVRRNAGQFEKKISSTTLATKDLNIILEGLKKDAPIDQDMRKILAKNIQTFGGRKLIESTDFKAVYAKLLNPESQLSAADKQVLRAAAGNIVTVEEKDELLPKLKKASEEALLSLQGDAQRLFQTGSTAGPRIIAPVGIRVVGETIQSLRRQAEQALLPEDLAIFSKELDAVVESRIDTLEKLTLESKMQKLVEESQDHDTGRKKVLDTLMRDSSLHAGLAETLGNLADKDFYSLLDALQNDPVEATQKLDAVLLSHPELDDVALVLKQKILIGSYAESPQVQELAPLYGLGEEGTEPDEKMKAAAYRLEAEHDGRRLARVCRTFAEKILTPQKDGSARAVRIKKLNEMDDLQFVSYLIEQQGTSADATNAERLLIRTYALLSSATQGKPQTAKELLAQPVIKNRRYNEEYLNSVLKIGITDEKTYKSAGDVLSSGMSVWNSERLGNRFFKVVGDFIGKDLSEERLGWKGLEALLHSEGYMAADEILRAQARKALKIKTGGDIDMGTPEVLRNIVQLPSFFGNDGGLSLFRAGSAAEFAKQKKNGTLLQSDWEAADPTMQKAREELKAARGNNTKGEGATLAIGLLGAEKVLNDITECTDDAEMSKLLTLLSAVKNELPEYFDPLAMVKKRARLESTNEEKGNKTLVQGLRDQIRTEMGEIVKTGVDTSERKERANKLLELFEANGLHRRGLAALELKDAKETFETKVKNAIKGKGAEAESLRTYLAEEYGESLGKNRIVTANPESVMTGKMKSNLRITTEVGLLRVFQEQVPPTSFKEFIDNLGKTDSDAYKDSVKRLNDTLVAAKFVAEGNKVYTPLAGNPSKAIALAERMVENYIDHVKKAGGSKDYLEKQAASANIVHLDTILSKDQGKMAGKELAAVKKQDTLSRLMDNMKDRKVISVKSATSVGATVEAEVVELSGEFSLDVAISNELMIRQEGTTFSVYLNSKKSAELGAKFGYDVLEIVSLEAGATFSAALTKGLKLDFDDKAKCMAFLTKMLAAEAPSESTSAVQKSKSDSESDQLLRLTKNISAIRQYEGGLKLEAGISKGEKLEEVLNKLKQGRDVIDALQGKEKDSREAIDFSLAASLYMGGSRRIEEAGVDHLVVTNKVIAKAEASAKATFFDVEKKAEGEKTFEAALECRYTGKKLTGAKMTRTFKIKIEDDAKDSDKVSAATRQLKSILTDYNINNASILTDIENEFYSADDLTIIVDAELTGEGLSQYEKADGELARISCLSNRKNYRNTGVSAEMGVTSRSTEWSLEKKVEAEALGEGGSVAGRFKRTTEGNIRQSFRYRAH
jgi:hypothetical protein